MVSMDKRILREARHKLGKTQEEMASALGASFRQYSRWENGHSPIPDDMAFRLKNLGTRSPKDLSQFSSLALVKELENRARQWDIADRNSQGDLGSSLRLVASDYEDIPDDDEPATPNA